MNAPLESEIQNAILIKYGREPDLTIWRQNTGVARSEVVTRAHLERLLGLLAKPNIEGVRSLLLSLLRERPTFTRYGLCVGSSDLVGIVSIPRVLGMTNGQPVVGTERTGIFLAAEIKRPGKHPTKEQQQFLDLINSRGGVAGCVHSCDEFGALLEQARNR